MNELEQELHTARNLHAGATRRAARAWAVIQKLRAVRLLLPADVVLNVVAQNIYYSSRYDASERYEDIEDFKESLKEDLDKAFTVEEQGGKPHYVLQPFFGKSDLLHHMRLGYLNGYSSDEKLEGLDVKPQQPAKAGVVSGLEPEEMAVVIAHHRRAATTLVNLMRTTCTALRYIRSGLEDIGKNAEKPIGAAVAALDVKGLLDELEAEVSLPFEPAPSTFFGTEADRINKLQKLPAGPGCEALLAAP